MPGVRELVLDGAIPESALTHPQMSDTEFDSLLGLDLPSIHEIEIDLGYVTLDTHSSLIQQGCPNCGTLLMHRCEDCHPSPTPGTYAEPSIIADGWGFADGEDSYLTATQCENCEFTIGIYHPLSELELGIDLELEPERERDHTHD